MPLASASVRRDVCRRQRAAVPAPGRRRETVAKPVAAAARPIGTSIGRCVALGTRSGQGPRQTHSRLAPAKLAGQCRPIDVDLSIALPGQRAGEGVTAGQAGKRLPLDGELRHSRAREQCRARGAVSSLSLPFERLQAMQAIQEQSEQGGAPCESAAFLASTLRSQVCRDKPARRGREMIDLLECAQGVHIFAELLI
jgi:hypothetical protein